AQGLEKNLEAMMNGTPPPGASGPIIVPLGVPGLDGLPLKCKGLRDCLKVAKDEKARTVTNLTKLKGHDVVNLPGCPPQGCVGLQKFHTDTNNTIRTGVQQVSDLFKLHVDAAKDQFDRVKQLLHNAGINIDLGNPKDTGIDDFCPESDAELCKLPGDFGKKM